MQKKIKKIVELFGAKSIEERYKVKDITVIPDYGEEGSGDFERVEIKFKEDSFCICVDRDYYLKYNNKKKLRFIKGEARAIHFTKDKIVKGEVKESYPTLLRRAGEALAIVLEGAFEKEIDIEEQ